MNSSVRAQWALTLIRLFLGLVFIAHGAQKVIGLWGGPGLETFTTTATRLGVPHHLCYASAFIELIAGCMLFLGIYTELGASLLLPVMIGGIYYVHWPQGFYVPQDGFEFLVALIVLLIALIVAGPGSLALSHYRR